MWGRRALGILVLMVGCAGGATVAVAPKGPQHPERVILAPVSFNQNVPELLEPGVPVLAEEIEWYLRQRGCDVATPSLAAFDDLWKQSGSEIGTLYDEEGKLQQDRFDAAVGALVAALRRRGESFDALVLPYLHLRQGRFRGKSVTWDGVRRKLQIEYAHHDVVQVGFDRGTTPVTSVRILVYDADGSKQLDSYGGLELTLEMKISGDFYHLFQRTDLFEDPEPLRDGVRVAFEPYFGD